MKTYAHDLKDWFVFLAGRPVDWLSGGSATFATVRLRQRVTKGPGSGAAGMAMAFKLIEAAQVRWRAVNAPTWSPFHAPSPV